MSEKIETSAERAGHTPGPWATFAEELEGERAEIDAALVDCLGQVDSPFGVCVEETGLTIAYMQIGENCGQTILPAEAEANARLIAAAPDLLEALRPFAAYAETRDQNDPGMPNDVVVCAYVADFRGSAVQITLGNCRAAQALIAKAEGRS